MKFCQDKGHSHFLKPWEERNFSLELAAGEKDILFLLARGEPHDFAVSIAGKNLSLRPCAPCDLEPRHFRWMEAALPSHADGDTLSIMVIKLEAALAGDKISSHPVIRISDGSPPEYLSPSYHDPSLPTETIRQLLPSPLNNLLNPDWPEVWSIAIWIHEAWKYRNTHHGNFYCPWRFDEILRWGRPGKGPDGEPAIAMCVHYAVAFQQCCLALGTPARLIPLMPHPNGENGHFVAEFWSRSLNKWILIDSQAGLCYLNEFRQPLNTLELSQHDNPSSFAHSGSSVENLAPLAKDFPYLSSCETSLFRHIGVWRCCDFYTDQDHAASGHGTTAYAETDILWLDQGTHPPMFPYALKLSDYEQEPGHSSAGDIPAQQALYTSQPT